jgi:hypothetical protein
MNECGNRNENSIIHHVLNSSYQHILYYQNVILFHGNHTQEENMAFPGTSFKETHKYSKAFSASLICQISLILGHMEIMPRNSLLEYAYTTTNFMRLLLIQ